MGWQLPLLKQSGSPSRQWSAMPTALCMCRAHLAQGRKAALGCEAALSCKASQLT